MTTKLMNEKLRLENENLKLKLQLQKAEGAGEVVEDKKATTKKKKKATKKKATPKKKATTKKKVEKKSEKKDTPKKADPYRWIIKDSGENGDCIQGTYAGTKVSFWMPKWAAKALFGDICVENINEKLNS